MKPDLTRLAGAALRKVAARFVEQEATPVVCQRMKREFIQVMREDFGVDWSRYARQISVSFIDGHRPNLNIPPRLLKRTVH
jgi:hypothetical protein